MSMHRLMALSTVCGSMSFCSVVASVGSGGASLRDAIRRPAPGQPLPPVGAGTYGQRPRRDRFPRRRPAGGGHGVRRVDVIGAKDVRSWGRRHRGHASRLGGPGAGGDVVVPAAVAASPAQAVLPLAGHGVRLSARARWRRSRRRAASCTSIATSRRPTAACGGAGGRSRQRDAGAADGRRERPERPAGSEPWPTRHGGDPRQRDDGPRRGGVRRGAPGELVPA